MWQTPLRPTTEIKSLCFRDLPAREKPQRRILWKNILTISAKRPLPFLSDNFYLGKDKVPKLPDGRSDFESINALNVEEMTKCIGDLIKHGHCDMPEFDFVAGKPKDEKIPLDLPEDGIAVFEGIHALNSMILDELPSENIFKIYVSVKDGCIRRSKKICCFPRGKFVCQDV